MSEQTWLRGKSPLKLLDCLDVTAFSDRRLRLFACACCRLVWDELPDWRSRRVVEVVERFLEGEATEAELKRAARLAHGVIDLVPSGTAIDPARRAAISRADAAWRSADSNHLADELGTLIE